MEAKVIIDTTVLVDFLRDKKYAKNAIQELIHEENSLHTTDINAFELYHGAYKSRRQDKNLASVKGILNSLTLLSTTEDSMEIAGKTAAELDRKGEKIEIRDLLIGSIALVEGCSVLTNNRKHFERIRGLDVISPE